LAIELPQGVQGRDDVDRSSGEALGRVGRGGGRGGDHAIGIDGGPASREAGRQRRSMGTRVVGHHAVWDPAGIEAREGPIRTGDRFALEDQDAIGIEDQAHDLGHR
jgi:hypothetical protein